MTGDMIFKLLDKYMSNNIKPYRENYVIKMVDDINELKLEELPKHIGKDTMLVLKAFTEDTIKDCERLRDYFPSYVHYLIFVERKLYNTINANPKSPYEQFSEAIILHKPNINRRLVYQLYSRLHGDVDKAVELIMDKNITTVAQLNKVIAPIEDIYPNEIILPLLMENRRVRLDSWKKKSFKFVDTLGEEMAYYSLKNYINKLYEDKYDEMSGKIFDKRVNLLKEIRINRILNMKLMIEKYNPKSVRVMLYRLQKGDEYVL